MPHKVTLKPSAFRDLEKLPLATRRRLGRKIDSLSQNPRPRGAEKIRGSEGALRLRVGTYRILYEVQDRARRVLVFRVAHRRQIYRGL